jgi:hypothetical protein
LEPTWNQIATSFNHSAAIRTFLGGAEMILPTVVTALIQTAACVLCVGLGYQMGFREGEKIEREKHIEDDSPIGMEHSHGE